MNRRQRSAMSFLASLAIIFAAVLSTSSRSAQALAEEQSISCPCIRYQPWDTLTNKVKSSAKTLGYDSDTWDGIDYASSRVELKRWDELTAEKQVAASELGYEATTWDCCINHYESYAWSVLANSVPTAHAAVLSLGYEQGYWDGSSRWYDPPLVESKTWCANVTSAEEDICLTAKEIEAARALCYSESIYRGDALVGNGLLGGGGTRYVGPDHCR